MACPYNSEANGETEELEHTYVNYLKLDKLLSLQNPTSWKTGSKKFHEEHIFIVVHQAYELWFKQLAVEVDSVREIMDSKEFDSAAKFLVIKRLNRIKVIMQLLVEQVKVIQTISVSDFMEFRENLHAASGFDSFQFRIFENKFGIREDLRVKLNRQKYSVVFKDENVAKFVEASEKEPSLFKIVEKWLENNPYLSESHFNFPKKFQQAVQSKLEKRKQTIKDLVDQDEINTEELKLKNLENTYERVFDAEQYNVLKSRGDKRFSHKAFLATLMIWIFKDEEPFLQSFQILQLLKEIDETISKWRHNHMLMVQDLIGSSSVGTGSIQGYSSSVYNSSGGSSGYHYLRATVSDRYKVFLDLVNLAPYLITMPRMQSYE